MRETVPFGVASATEIARRGCQMPADTDTGVSVSNFGRHAKLAWPFKTAAHIAVLAKTSERHAARMLTGEFEAPASVITALLAEITKRA